MTEELILQIDHWLRQNRPAYHSNLRSGASAQVIEQAQSRIGIHFPQSFRALYSWRNGQDRADFEPLLLNLTFMSLDAVIENKEMLDSMIGTEFLEPDWWRRDWIPFLENGGGDLLCLDVGGYKTGTANQILWFNHEGPEREIIHNSVDDFCIDLLHRMKTKTLELA